MKAAKLFLAALVIFLAGMAGGSAVSGLRTKGQGQSEREPREAVPSPMSYRIDFLRRVQKELKLSDEQKGRIDGYVRESQERLRLLWEPMAPKARAEFDSLREKIRSELNPEQRERFDQTLRERSRRGENRDRDRRPGETNRPHSSDGPGTGANSPATLSPKP
ncbi:MAG TPA: hypothetical protein PLX89_13955 [Verrucomicrobiota bacterium]|nr:hypothetical protein [Verrucomicrobiales bacterium]HRI14097.1 hypothetical protein [Verrucomicrobiota bacterium]